MSVICQLVAENKTMCFLTILTYLLFQNNSEKFEFWVPFLLKIGFPLGPPFRNFESHLGCGTVPPLNIRTTANATAVQFNGALCMHCTAHVDVLLPISEKQK